MGSREELLIRGLRFDYHTHYWENPRGERYYYCFDHGFLLLNSGDQGRQPFLGLPPFFLCFAMMRWLRLRLFFITLN
jgi:hypothetical protein